MRIGIVVPAHNVARYIGDTVCSVLAQSHREWTMVVVDDGSSDGTAGVVRTCPDRRIRLIVQPNGGVSAARNRGVRDLDCDAVLFLDGDDCLAPRALAVLSDTLLHAPRAIAAVGAYARGGRVYRPASGDILQRLLVRNLFANGGHVLIRRTAIVPFRTDLRFGEDWEYWVRLALSARRSGTEAGAIFAAASEPRPLLDVRERSTGAFLNMATDPASYEPCLAAIHANPDLAVAFTPRARAALRYHAAAEVDWAVGRELIRHRRHPEGLRSLWRAFAAAPTVRRAILLAAWGVLPPRWRGPLYPYDEKYDSAAAT